MSKQDNVETRLEPNFGKLFQTNTELTPLEPTMETQICNWKELTFITMKLPEEDTSLELSWWIWNQVLWTQSELDLSVNYSDQTTLYSDRPELETTGLKDITPKELNWSTQSWMLLEKKLKDATAYKDSKSPTH